LEKIIKTVKTLLKKKQISKSDLKKILIEVEKETVETLFFKKQPYYTQRYDRLDKIKKALSLK